MYVERDNTTAPPNTLEPGFDWDDYQVRKYPMRVNV